MDTFNLRCLQYEPIKRTFITAWTDHTCIALCVDSPNVCCLDDVHIKLTLFPVCSITPTLLTVWTNHTYVVYSMEPLSLRWLHHGCINISCLQYELIKLTLFTL